MKEKEKEVRVEPQKDNRVLYESEFTGGKNDNWDW